MKKVCAFLLMLSCVCFLASACVVKQKPNMVQSTRRFEKYIAPSQNNSGAVIDLSEGPKQNYDANLGPQNLNFDMKIVDPY